MKYPTNDGRFFAAWRYVESRQHGAQLVGFLFIVWVYLALSMSGGSTNKSWRGHAEKNFWYYFNF